ncbi:MAG: plasmid pRiA4b ORF-3 family protein [Tannerella sp.]|jgi:hypothetical protein|nr:plasmid pRiA4b ORF-3 family protein [Tannerella sp.]
MIYRFLILSDEVDDFKREIKISPESTFFDLHKAILEATDYREDQICSFFICDEEWNKKTEITLIDMGASSETDTYLMEDTPLDELLEDEHQKLLYVFDYMIERVFFMELSEIIPGQSLDKAVCTLSAGMPPPQIISAEEMEKRLENVDIDDEFYGDSEYDEDELDKLNYNESADGFFEDERY